MNTKTLTLLAATAAVLSTSAAIRFDNLFCDHAVLQRGQTVPVWGHGAAPGTRVKLTLGDWQAWALASARRTVRSSGSSPSATPRARVPSARRPASGGGFSGR